MLPKKVVKTSGRCFLPTPSRGRMVMGEITEPGFFEVFGGNGDPEFDVGVEGEIPWLVLDMHPGLHI